MDDKRIIELYFARDEQAIKETEQKYGKLCFSLAHNILGNREDSEECVNDAYRGLWNTIPPKRPQNFKAFVCAITRNLSLKKLEHETRQKRDGGTLVSFEELEEFFPDSALEGQSDEQIGVLISTFLRGEKEDVRRVFLRKYYFFDSTKDIAKRYGFTESKVKNMLYHTREKLKEYLIEEGIKL